MPALAGALLCGGEGSDAGKLGGGGVASSSSPSSGEEVIGRLAGLASGDAPAGRLADILGES